MALETKVLNIDFKPPKITAQWGAEPSGNLENLKVVENFTLVSSDGERFAVPTPHLLCSSNVFSEALQMATGDCCIEFTDDEMETAPVIRLFWSLLVYAEFGPSFRPSLDGADAQEPLKTLVPLLLFLQKYSMANLLKHATALVCKLTCNNRLPPYCCLVVGAVANDIDTCLLALRRMGPGEYSSPTLGIPYQLWNKIPLRLTWALAHSWNNSRFNAGTFSTLAEGGDLSAVGSSSSCPTAMSSELTASTSKKRKS